MRTLAAINSLFAAVLLLFGAFALFALGITGLFFLIPGVIIATVAAVTWGGSRMALLLATVVDGTLGFASINKLLELSANNTSRGAAHAELSLSISKGNIEFLVPVFTLLLLSVAAIAVALDWRSVRSAKWF
jgi:hypothetical protein